MWAQFVESLHMYIYICMEMDINKFLHSVN